MSLSTPKQFSAIVPFWISVPLFSVAEILTKSNMAMMSRRSNVFD